MNSLMGPTMLMMEGAAQHSMHQMMSQPSSNNGQNGGPPPGCWPGGPQGLQHPALQGLPHPIPGHHGHFPGPGPLLIPGGHIGGHSQMPINASMNRSQRCGVCRGCQCKPCGACTYCQDSPQFGGPGVKKQSCIERRCLRVLENRLQRDAPTFKARVGCNGCEDCRMPDCQICLVCLDKRFFENRYMTGAMCAKKRCNNATSIELPNQEFQQRQAKKRAYEPTYKPRTSQAQKRAYEATMEFHMKRRMEMASSFVPILQGGIPHPPPGMLIQQSIVPPPMLLQPQQPSQIVQIPPSLTPSSAATPPALSDEAGSPDDSSSSPSLLHSQSQSLLSLPPLPQSNGGPMCNQGLIIDPRIFSVNNNMSLPPPPPATSSSSLLPPLLGLPPTTSAPSLESTFAPSSLYNNVDIDYFAKAYYMDDFSSQGMTVLPNGDPFVPPSYAPEMKNAVVLQPL